MEDLNSEVKFLFDIVMTNVDILGKRTSDRTDIGPNSFRSIIKVPLYTLWQLTKQSIAHVAISAADMKQGWVFYRSLHLYYVRP